MGKLITTKETKSINILTILGVFSVFMVLTLVVLYLNAPVIKTRAAEEAASASANIESVASISVDPVVSLNITPSGSTGGSDVEAVNVKVMTNSRTGYILKMAAEGDSSSMTSQTSSQTIDSDFSGGDYSAGDTGKVINSIGDNKWVFSEDGTNFFVVPTTGNEVELVNTLSSTANVWNTHTYYFGAHATASLESGTYSKNITFTAVAYNRATTFYDIDYMHEMSSDICANTPTATSNAITAPTPNNSLAEAQTGEYIAQTILTDFRDMKTYLVRKYANGECWMAQNLEHDFYVDSDSVADGTSNTGTYSTTETGKNTSTISNNTATLGADNLESWLAYSDINDYDYFSTDNTDPTDGASAYNTGVFYATQNFSGSDYGWDDDGHDGARSYSTPAYVSANPTATMKNYIVKDSTSTYGYYLFKESATGERYQRVGNYYNFAMAKAGYLGDDTGTNPDNSICPRHWTLPTVSGDKSFRNLITYYYGSWTSGGNNTDLYNWLSGSPLDFWKNGYYNRGYGAVASRPTFGYWWTNNTYSNEYGNTLRVRVEDYAGYVNASFTTYRGMGLAIRCVVR